MANTVQARKRARQSAQANAHNSALRSKFRTAIKAVRKAIDSGDQAKANEVYKVAAKTLDIIADKHIVHKNKAARHKSRLSAAIKGLSAPAQQQAAQ
jgi:small subunit ribosomal protein S20